MKKTYISPTLYKIRTGESCLLSASPNNTVTFGQRLHNNDAWQNEMVGDGILDNNDYFSSIEDDEDEIGLNSR